jgi:hypothetical protein
LKYFTYSKDEESGDVIYYQFTTDNCYYTVVFDPFQYSNFVLQFPNLLNNGVGFSFFKTPFNIDNKIRHNPKVGSTVCQIVKDYISEQTEDVVLLYHCDHRQEGRSKVFSNWDAEHNTEGVISRREVSFEYLDKTYYMGYITLKDNALVNEVNNEFDSFAFEIVKEDSDKPNRKEEE